MMNEINLTLDKFKEGASNLLSQCLVHLTSIILLYGTFDIEVP